MEHAFQTLATAALVYVIFTAAITVLAIIVALLIWWKHDRDI